MKPMTVPTRPSTTNSDAMLRTIVIRWDSLSRRLAAKTARLAAPRSVVFWMQVAAIEVASGSKSRTRLSLRPVCAVRAEQTA